MGTNFYFTPIGEEPLHIGKRSGAGGGLCSFTLQGHKDKADAPIDSWQRWKQVMTLVPGTIHDEYGVEINKDDFIQEVESTTMANRRRQFDWMEANYPNNHTDWLCPDGFSFIWTDFS